MPYLILVIGVIIGLIAFYRFFTRATPAQVRLFFRVVIIILFIGVLLFFAFTGRIIISLGLLLLSVPIALKSYKENKNKNKDL